MSQFTLQKSHRGLTTVEVFFYMPDHPLLLERLLWQCNDLYPQFPRINRFLDFWLREIEAAIQGVQIAHHMLKGTHELRLAKGIYHLQ